jgi:hypothetical protein
MDMTDSSRGDPSSRANPIPYPVIQKKKTYGSEEM